MNHPARGQPRLALTGTGAGAVVTMLIDLHSGREWEAPHELHVRLTLEGPSQREEMPGKRLRSESPCQLGQPFGQEVGDNVGFGRQLDAR